MPRNGKGAPVSAPFLQTAVATYIVFLFGFVHFVANHATHYRSSRCATDPTAQHGTGRTTYHGPSGGTALL